MKHIDKIFEKEIMSSTNCMVFFQAKAGRGSAAFFPIIPTVIGEIKITITATSSVFKDTVIKTLRVEVRY
jgi:hypothetical protein